MKNSRTNLNRLKAKLAVSGILGGLLASLSLAHGQGTPGLAQKKEWETIASAGMTLTRGNSQNFLANVGINSSRKWNVDELLLGASAGYGETTQNIPGTGSVTSRTESYVKGSAQWNHLLSQRWYGGLRLTGEHDDVADVDYRATLSPLLGYYLIKTTNTILSLEAGPSYVRERLAGVDHGYVAARLGQRFEHKFESGAKVWETLEWIPQISRVENWILNFEAGVSAPITKSLDVRLVAQDSYDNEPATGRLKNDFKLIAGIGYKF